MKLVTAVITGMLAALLVQPFPEAGQWVGGLADPPPVGPNAVTATTWDQLNEAVASGAREVHIPDRVVITVPNERSALWLQEGQRIVGTRSASARGPLLRVSPKAGTNDYPIVTMSADSAIEGIRFAGPNAGPETANRTIGIQTAPGSQHATIRNNELYGWSWAAVSVKQSQEATIEYNHIHDNLRRELGYGVVVQNGNASALIRRNVFEANRHAIAGSGAAGERYTAVENLVLQGGGSNAYHQFDMHARPMGGQDVHIVGNIFDYGRPGTANRSSVLIRGVPTDGPATVTGNLFTQPWTVGRQKAVEGVPGSIADPSSLQAGNAFNTPIQYVKNRDGCWVRTPTQNIHALCSALGQWASLPLPPHPF